jgi:threonine aldolase
VSQTFIDLRSDTVTKPSAAMRQAMATAEVGDDVLDGDPTVKQLEAKVAELMGTERALFFPTGTMANQTAVVVLSKPGTEIFMHDDSHVINWEFAGYAMFGGAGARLIRGAPRITLDTFKAAVRGPSRDAPKSSLLSLENTHNGSGGMVTPVDELSAIAAHGRSLGLAVHLDGARLWNAHIATGTPLKDFASVADLTMLSFAKGLGAPVGAVLVGSAALIDRAWDARKRFGGGMRQSGMLAAGCRYGLEHNLARMSDDHANAKVFAAIVAEAKHANVVPPDTGIVMTDLGAGLDSAEVIAKAREKGVKFSAWAPTRVRAVMHLDHSREEIERAAAVLRDILN